MPLFKRSPAKGGAVAPVAPGGAGPDAAAASASAAGPLSPITISPTALAFSSTAPTDQEQGRSLTIANPSFTASVAFKVRTSNPAAHAVDCASGVLGPLASRRVRVFRLAGVPAPPPSASSPGDVFCVTALALPPGTPLPEAASAALTGRMGDGATDILVPVLLAAGLEAGGPPPVGVATSAAVAAAAAAIQGGADPAPLLTAFATLLAAKGLVEDLGGALATVAEVVAGVPARPPPDDKKRRPGSGLGAGPPPTPTPVREGGGGGAVAAQAAADDSSSSGEEEEEEEGDGGGPPPITTAVPAFADRIKLFEAGGRRE